MRKLCYSRITNPLFSNKLNNKSQTIVILIWISTININIIFILPFHLNICMWELIMKQQHPGFSSGRWKFYFQSWLCTHRFCLLIKNGAIFSSKLLPDLDILLYFHWDNIFLAYFPLGFVPGSVWCLTRPLTQGVLRMWEDCRNVRAIQE